MLNWYGKVVESVGHVIIENACGNNQMISQQIQKELVRACAKETMQAIIDEIVNSHFSILLDECHDKTVKEQIAVIVRFVNKQGQVVERFLGIEHVTNTSTPLLKAILDEFFASNMKGQFNGLKTLILNENPFVFNVHCFAH